MSSTKPVVTRNPNVTDPERQPLLKSSKKEKEQPPPAVSKDAVHGLVEQANRKAPPPENPPLLDRNVVRQQPTPTTVAYSANGQTVEITMEEDQNGGATGSGQPGSNANTNVGRAPNYGTVVTNQPTSRVGAANLSNDVVNQALVDFMQGLGYPNLTEDVLNNPNDISLTEEVKGQLTESGQDTLCKHLNSLKKTLLHERYSASYMPTGAGVAAAVGSGAVGFQAAGLAFGIGAKGGTAAADLMLTNGEYLFNEAGKSWYATAPIGPVTAASLFGGILASCGIGMFSSLGHTYTTPATIGIRSQLMRGDYRLAPASVDQILPTPCNIDPSTGRILTKAEFSERTAEYKELKTKIEKEQASCLPHVTPYGIALNTLLYGGFNGLANVGVGQILPGIATSGASVAAQCVAGVLLGTAASAVAGGLTLMIQHNILANKTINTATVDERGDYDSNHPKSMCLLKSKDVLPHENPENKSNFTRSYESSQKAAVAGRPFGTVAEKAKLLGTEAVNRSLVAAQSVALLAALKPFGVVARDKINDLGVSEEVISALKTGETLGEAVVGHVPVMLFWFQGLNKLVREAAQGAAKEEQMIKNMKELYSSGMDVCTDIRRNLLENEGSVDSRTIDDAILSIDINTKFLPILKLRSEDEVAKKTEADNLKDDLMELKRNISERGQYLSDADHHREV